MHLFRGIFFFSFSSSKRTNCKSCFAYKRCKREGKNNGSQPLDSFSFGLSSFILDTDNIGFQCLDAKLSDRCEKLPEKTLLCFHSICHRKDCNAVADINSVGWPNPIEHVGCWHPGHPRAHIVWKLLKMSHLNFGILAFSTNFCPIKTYLSGNTVWWVASVFKSSPKWSVFGNFN